MREEYTIFNNFIRRKGLRATFQREKILKIFLSIERHISLDELYAIVKRKELRIGYTTVYRTMKLLTQCGICEESDFGEGSARYEHKYGHEHHDHLICTACGKFIEVRQPRIEALQEALAKEHGFTPMRHTLQIFGICGSCGVSRLQKP